MPDHDMQSLALCFVTMRGSTRLLLLPFSSVSVLTPLLPLPYLLLQILVSQSFDMKSNTFTTLALASIVSRSITCPYHRCQGDLLRLAR